MPEHAPVVPPMEPAEREVLGHSGGNFIRAGEFAARITHPCPTDFNADGRVTTTDVPTFLNAWSAGCCSKIRVGQHTATRTAYDPQAASSRLPRCTDPR